LEDYTGVTPGILDDFIEQFEQQENNQPKKHIPQKNCTPAHWSCFYGFISGRDPSFFTGQAPIKLMNIIPTMMRLIRQNSRQFNMYSI